MTIVIEAEPFTSPDATALVDELEAELSARYPTDEAPPAVDPAAFDGHRGAFFVARVAGTAVGCVGVVRRGPSDAEIRRMYVRPADRGTGVADALLGAAERWALVHDRWALVLETGERQPEAIAVYRRHGFVPVPCVGEWVATATSRCFEKRLSRSAR